MKLLWALAALIVGLAPLPAAAQLFGNPFLDAAAYRDARGVAPADATYRVRYEVTRTRPDEAPTTTEVIVDVAPDWSLTREGDQVVLRDFRLNRYFMIAGGTFVSANNLAEL